MGGEHGSSKTAPELLTPALDLAACSPPAKACSCSSPDTRLLGLASQCRVAPAGREEWRQGLLQPGGKLALTGH